jgi:DNA-binding MarR family transcriptional regulator
MKCPKCRSDEEVKRFFEEHPIHSFTIRAIAEYLKLPEGTVTLALNYLILDDFVEAEFRLAHPEKLSHEEKVGERK